MSDETMRAELDALRREVAELQASVDLLGEALKAFGETQELIRNALRPIAGDWQDYRDKATALLEASRAMAERIKKLEDDGEDWKGDGR